MKELKIILDMWQKDCAIDGNDLAEVSRRTPNLQSKYLQLLSEAKIQLKRAELNQKTLLKDKWLYYNGKMTEEDIQAKGWKFDPFDGLRILKGEMDYYYDSDTEIQNSIEAISNWKICVETLTDIVSNINWRHQTISNMIRWKTFEAGG